MKILVQGTKGGAKIFYPQTTPDEFYTFAGDVRDINGSGGVGEQAYSIALTADGCVFSKYLGVRDVQRSWEGNVSFSLFLSYRQKMPGERIQALLDELLGTYADRYIEDGNLDIVHEDWSFIDEITAKYESDVKVVFDNDLDTTALGNGSPAFLYYNDEEDLRRYFDFPYQREYLPYKQVFLLDIGEKTDPLNLLNALRHDPDADLTGKVDLENPRLVLANFDSNGRDGVRITLKANGRLCQNKSKFYRKDDLELTYSKPGCLDKVITGRLSDSASEIGHYVKVVDGDRVDVLKTVELDPKTVGIILQVVDETGKKYELGNSQISVRVYTDRDASKQVLSDRVTFIGEETVAWWNVEASLGSKKGQCSFRPSDKQDNDIVKIQMQEKPVEQPSAGNTSTTKRGGRSGQSGSGKYYIYVDPEKGRFDFLLGKDISQYPPKGYTPKPKQGYKFVRWNLVEGTKVFENKTYSGYYEALFKELWWHKIPGKGVTVAVAAVVLLGLFVLAAWLMFRPKQDSYDVLAKKIDQAVANYSTASDSLCLDSLQVWSEEWAKVKPDSAGNADLWKEWRVREENLQKMIIQTQHEQKAEAQWAEIKDSKDSTVFNAYLTTINDWHIDNHRQEAKDALGDIRAWEKAKAEAKKAKNKTAKNAAYQKYIQEHSSGRFKEEADSLLNGDGKGDGKGGSKGGGNGGGIITYETEADYIKLFWQYLSQKQPKNNFDVNIFNNWFKAHNANPGNYPRSQQYLDFYNKYMKTNSLFDQYFYKSDGRGEQKFKDIPKQIISSQDLSGLEKSITN